MPDVEEFSEAVTVAEEVAATGETVVFADLSTVSQQLDRIMTWQAVQFGILVALLGAVLGIAFGKALERMWH